MFDFEKPNIVIEEISLLEKEKSNIDNTEYVSNTPKEYYEVDYSLKRGILGYWISYVFVALWNIIEIRFGRPVSIKNMPEEMFRDNTEPNNLLKNE